LFDEGVVATIADGNQCIPHKSVASNALDGGAGKELSKSGIIQ
jgi:hypothetical protein